MKYCYKCGSELRKLSQRFCEYCGAELDSIGKSNMSEGYSQIRDFPANQYNQYGKQSNLYVVNSQKNPNRTNKPNKWCLVIIIIFIIFTVSYALSMAYVGVSLPGFG